MNCQVQSTLRRPTLFDLIMTRVTCSMSKASTETRVIAQILAHSTCVDKMYTRDYGSCTFTQRKARRSSRAKKHKQTYMPQRTPALIRARHNLETEIDVTT